MDNQHEIAVIPPRERSFVGTVRHAVGALMSRRVKIDADYERACAELANWTASCRSELDEVERRLREREEAIDVEDLNEARAKPPSAAPDPTVAQLLARAKALIAEGDS